ncbi:MOSC domain-containing protein [Mucilaginibacter gynuensis]|uniref:MOSC domain-containing protein n=1 Tax=Mucilaginibacter gynuensis TaxID=1302236 RepID=A0ABP8FRG2_9SPHI
MLSISAIYTYPIKSLGGISLDNSVVTDRGLEHDRRWMLVDANNRFVSQREFHQMALLGVSIEDTGLRVTHKTTGENVFIPFVPVVNESCEVTVWDDTCSAVYVSDEVDAWFSKVLEISCRLVYMPDDSHRKTDEKYTSDGEITSFSDGYPFLLIGQASLDDLNSRIDEALPMDRFRPNIVFTGGAPYHEDILKSFDINGINFFGVKLCARCVMTTINQNTAEKGKQPLKALAGYRNKNKKILFGQNIVHKGTGAIGVGDTLENITLHNEERFLVNASPA